MAYSYNKPVVFNPDGIFCLPISMLLTVPLSVEFQIVGDITKENTLIPEYFKGVRKVINAVSVIVGPKEGDTPDRAKYSQVRAQALRS